MKALRPVYNAIYYVLLSLCMLLFRLIYRIRVIGRENLIRKKGFVLAPNHPTSLDPVLIILARGMQKKMMVMAKKELFCINPLLNLVWHIAGVFPVARGSGNRQVLEEIKKPLKNGRGLMLFPEGECSPKEGLGALHSGAFILAMEAGVDIIPCLIWYSKGWSRPFSRCTVVFGKPMSPQELGLIGEYRASHLREAKRKFRERLENLYHDNRKKL